MTTICGNRISSAEVWIKVCNVKFPISSVGLHLLTLLVKYVGIRNIPATVFPPLAKKYPLLS